MLTYRLLFLHKTIAISLFNVFIFIISPLFKNKKSPLYTLKIYAYRGRYLNRGATSFEAKFCFLFSDTTIHLISYPFNGGTPCNPTKVQAASRKSIPQIHSYRLSTIPGSLKRIQYRVLLLLIDLDYLFFRNTKRASPSKKDEKPVVPPSLANKSAHLIDIKA